MHAGKAAGPLATAAGIAGVVVVASWFLMERVDLFAYLPDDGAYAYVAHRLNAGDVLHVDVQDVHTGYVNFVNALALSVFGGDIAGLRYPLLLLTIVQAAIVFWLLRTHGLLSATIGAGVMAGLTFVQFVNPTANWYCLFLTVLLALIVCRTGPWSAWRLLVIGLLVGLIFCFRQLTGAIVGIAVLLIVLSRMSHSDSSGERSAALALLVPAFLVMTLLVFRSGLVGAGLLFGSWPLALMAHQIYVVRVSNAAVVRSAALLLGGFVAALLPLVAYHLWHGSLSAWWYDAFVAAVALSGMDFIANQSFTSMPFLLLEVIAPAPTPAAVVSGVFWLTLLALPAALGIAALRFIRNDERPLPPLVYLASFYAVVSLHYQIPIYLMYSSGLTLVALLALTGSSRPAARMSAIGVASFCLLVGGANHAAKSPLDSLEAVFRGERTTPAIDCNLERLGLRLEEQTCDVYRQLLGLVDAHTESGDTLLALPVNPELYFLSGRKSAVWFFNSALALHDEEQLARAMARMRREPPAMVFYRERDKYNTPQARALMDELRNNYVELDTIGGFEVYRRADENKADRS